MVDNLEVGDFYLPPYRHILYIERGAREHMEFDALDDMPWWKHETIKHHWINASRMVAPYTTRHITDTLWPSQHNDVVLPV